MTKLYELTEELLYLFPDDDDGEIPAETMQKLNAVQLQWEDKVEGLWRLIRNLQSEADAYQMESARLRAHAESVDKRIAYLKDYLKGNMEQLGIDKIRTQLGSVSIQKNSRPSIAVAPGKEIPEGYRRVKVELDGNHAYDDWRNGSLPMDWFVVTLNSHLRLR